MRLRKPLFSTVAWAAAIWTVLGVKAASSFPGRNSAASFDAPDCGEQIVTLEKALAQNPRDAQVNLQLARCHAELGNYDRAIPYAERAVELDPHSSESHRWLGRAYGLKAERTHSYFLARKVRREFEAAVELNPGNLPARRDLMEFYLEAPWFLGGSKEKAWRQAEAIQAQDAVEGHLVRGAFWRSTQQPARAEIEYQQIFKLKPPSVEPYFELAEFYLSRNESSPADAAAEAASRLVPDDPRLAYFRGAARILDGRGLSEAERLLKDYLAGTPARRDFPSHASAHVWLGRLYERCGKMQQAAEEYQAALHSDPYQRGAEEGLRHLHINH